MGLLVQTPSRRSHCRDRGQNSNRFSFWRLTFCPQAGHHTEEAVASIDQTGSPQSHHQAGPAPQEARRQPDLGPAITRTPAGTSRNVRHVSDRRTAPQQKSWHPGRRDPHRTPSQVSQSQGEGAGERGKRRVGEVCTLSKGGVLGR